MAINRRGFLRAVVATFALTTGLARVKLDAPKAIASVDPITVGDVVTIQGLDQNYQVVSETIALDDGPIATKHQYSQIYRFTSGPA